MHSFRRTSIPRVPRPPHLRYAWLLLLLVLVPCQDRQTGRAQAEYDHAYQHFLHGELLQSQQEATTASNRYEGNDSAWAVKFRRLEVKCLIYRSLNQEAEKIVAKVPVAPGDSEGQIWKLSSESYFAWQRTDLVTAGQKLAQAEVLCRTSDFPVCGEVLQIQGEIDMWHGEDDKAWQHLLQALAFAHRHQDRWQEAEIEGTLGVAAFSHQRLDETIDWLSLAYRHQVEMGAGSQVLNVAMDLGAAYATLGDRDKALQLFSEGEKLTAGRGSSQDEIEVLLFWGGFYLGDGEPELAIPNIKKALEFFRRIGDQSNLNSALEMLSEAELEVGDVTDASEHYHQVLGPLQKGQTLPWRARLFLGRLAAARHKEKRATSLLLSIFTDSAIPKQFRIVAGRELARIYEHQGRNREAEQMYQSALAVFERSRTEVAHQESALSIVANAKSLYQRYVDLLVRQGRIEDALAVADSSRAQALARGLSVATEQFSFRHAGWNPRRIAKKSGATLLF